jgi:alkylation response protein AidB-like acyl-CoA dehydrogenase
MCANTDAPCTETIEETLAQALAGVDAGSIAGIPMPEVEKGYHRVILSQDHEKELCAARWLAGAESMLHGHGDSAAVYWVVCGTVEEERYIPEGDTYRYERAVRQAGSRVFLPPGSFHLVRALEPSLTLHGYAPVPVDHTSPIPAPVRKLLEEARKAVCEPRVRSLRLYGSAKPDLMLEIQRRLERWSEAERRDTQAGATRMPRETIEDFRASGILAAPLPASMDGWNCSLKDAAAAIRAIAQVAPSTALALAMPWGNAATTRIPPSCLNHTLRPSLMQGQVWIAEQIRRGCILAVANSEPGAGGDLKQTKTTASRQPDGTYHLSGRKSFATLGADADYFLCAARRAPLGSEPELVVDGFFVARDAAGLTLDDRWNPIGMRTTASVGLTLEAAPAAAILGYPGCLEGVNARHWSTVLFASVFLGIGEGALREAVKNVKGDGAWSRAALAECALNLDAAAGFIDSVARQDCYPLPSDVQERTRRAKTFACRAAVQTATQAATLSGGRCFTPEHPVFRFLCDAMAGPLLRPPLPAAMDAIANSLFPAPVAGDISGARVAA